METGTWSRSIVWRKYLEHKVINIKWEYFKMMKFNKYLCDFCENQEMLGFTNESFYSFCFHEVNYKMLADLTTGAVSS